MSHLIENEESYEKYTSKPKNINKKDRLNNIFALRWMSSVGSFEDNAEMIEDSSLNSLSSYKE